MLIETISSKNEEAGIWYSTYEVPEAATIVADESLDMETDGSGATLACCADV